MVIQRPEGLALLARSAARSMFALLFRHGALIAVAGLAALAIMPPRSLADASSVRASGVGIDVPARLGHQAAPPSRARLLAGAHGIAEVRSHPSGGTASPATPGHFIAIGALGTALAIRDAQWVATDRVPLTYDATAPPARPAA
jgi:hypothetical protein